MSPAGTFPLAGEPAPDLTLPSAYVLIDREGIVCWSFMEPSSRNRRENSELLEQIRAVA